MSYHFAADVGGTFTDLVLLSDNGILFIKKVLSTPPHYERAVIDGLDSLLGEAHVKADVVERVLHATTVATNAILERKGELTGLITTKGFRDVLELRRMRFPDTYNLMWEKPKPLVERYLRLEVDERIGAHGEIVERLDIEGTQAIVRQLVEEEYVKSLAVCFINSYVNPVHEQMLGELVRKRYPDLPLTLSADVLPEIKEYERASTAVINAYLIPVVARYLATLQTELAAREVTVRPLVMQSNGGLMPVQIAVKYPMHILESGPAAGVIAAASLARGLECSSVISFDMGGTTAKAAMIEDGEPRRVAEYEVGSPISMASRVLKGGGYLLRVPAIDVAEVGAGGGSVVYVDSGGQLHVGPRSAGANPGPVCYGLGGVEPTVTDANLVLGYFNPQLLGGQLVVDLANAKAALAKIAQATQLSLMETAFGVYRIANATMARAIRAVSIERGRDVRDSVMVVFGGCGPAHAAEIARSLGIKRVLVPRAPGVFSALGLAYANVERHLARTHRVKLQGTKPEELQENYDNLAQQARSELVKIGWPADAIEILRYADLRYQGQSSELRIAVDAGMLTPVSLSKIAHAFQDEYELTYGHAQEASRAEIVSLRVVARIAAEGPTLPPVDGRRSAAPSARRPAYFGPKLAFIDTPVISRLDLVGQQLAGPLIIEEYDSTIVVPPACNASIDSSGNVLIEIEETL